MGEELTENEINYISEIIWKKIEMNTDYDFYPKILYISIPINGPGYTATILVGIFSLIASIAI